MRQPSMVAVVAVCGVCVLTGRATAEERQDSPCAKETIPAVCAAARIEDGAARTEALDRALGQALQSASAEVRHDALRFLVHIAYPPKGSREMPFDPRRLRDALLRYDTLGTEAARRKVDLSPDELEHISESSGQSLLDDVELEHAAKADRLRTYERAIIDGEAEYGRVSKIERVRAINRASIEGLSELAAVIAVRCPDLGEQDQQYVGGCEHVAAALELRAGAETTADANSRAAKRLAAMPAAELFAKLKTSPAWRSLVGETAEAVCVGGSLDDCRGLKPMFEGLESFMRKNYASPPAPPDPTPVPDVRTFEKEMKAKVGRGASLVAGRLHWEEVEAKDRLGRPK